MAQPAATWPVTRLDSTASVRMPFAGTRDEADGALGVTIYSASTSDNEFDALVFTPQPDAAHPLKAGQKPVPDVSKFLSLLMKMPDQSFSQAKLKSSFPVTLPSAPGNTAMHQVYTGFDEFHQLPAALELTWVLIGPRLYVFRCSYSLPEERAADEEMRRFFTSIVFSSGQP